MHNTLQASGTDPVDRAVFVDERIFATNGESGPEQLKALQERSLFFVIHTDAADWPRDIQKLQDTHQLNSDQSFFIGDHPQMLQVAQEAGLYGLYILTGCGAQHLAGLSWDTLVFHRLTDALEWIESHPDPEAYFEAQGTDGAAAIRRGEVVAFPTETVYGLGADAFQPDAVKKIFDIKGRPHNNPLIAHISSEDQIETLVTHVPDAAKKLMHAFWPGPLTLVFPKRSEVPDVVTAGHPTVAVRMPAHPIARELIRRCGTALVAPSANLFTCTSPTTAQHVSDQLGARCKQIIDGGACRVGLESTVLSLTGPTPKLLRPGGISKKEIEDVIGPIDEVSQTQTSSSESPGMMRNHYAPATPLSAFTEIPSRYETDKNVGVLLFEPTSRRFSGTIEVLSQTGDPAEAAAHLFTALRRLDALGLREIVAEYAPKEGVGIAINNRLSKATQGRSLPQDEDTKGLL